MKLLATLTALIVTLAATAVTGAHQAPPPAPQGSAVLAGTVTAADTGRPIANVTVRFVRWDGGLGTSSATRTDASGKFRAEKLLPGSYEIATLNVDGYIAVGYGQRTPTDPARRVELADGQELRDLAIALPRAAAVEGTLVDEFGDPAPGIVIGVWQVQFAAGARRLTPAPGPRNVQPTDDRGHFRVFGLVPGDYYISALSGPFAGPDDVAGFAVTYYPGVVDPQKAVPTHVDVGKDVLDLSFALAPTTPVSISGVAVDDAGKPVQASLLLMPTSGGDVRALLQGRAMTQPDGAFAFRNVAPGNYVIQAYGRPVGGGNLARAPFGAILFPVTGDRDDLRVVVRMGASLKGKFVLDGDGTPPAADRLTLQGVPINFAESPVGGGPPEVIVNPDYTFEMKNQNGFRRVRGSIGARGWFIKSVFVNGKDMIDAPIDFSKGDVENVEVVVSNRAGTIAGMVASELGGAPAAHVVVRLLAADPEQRAFPSRFDRTVTTGADGAFSVGDLAPGNYLVLAVTSMDPARAQDPDYLATLLPKATAVTVVAGRTHEMTLLLIPPAKGE